MLVKVTPKCKRAKERVKQHGDVFDLIDENQQNGKLVKSLGKTFSNNGEKIEWMGWFKNNEADIKNINEEQHDV